MAACRSPSSTRLPARVVFPSHGPATAAGARALAAQLQHRRQREAAILAAISGGASDVDSVVARVYTDVPTAMHGYAALSVRSVVRKLVAASAVVDERLQGEIFINLRADGSIVLNDRQVELEELHQILSRVAQYFPGGSVIIRGDRAADLGRAIAVLDVCKQVDIQNVSFAALPQEENVPEAQ